MRRTIYYKDMLNDDFSDNGIKRKKLPRDYQYISKDPLRKTADFMLHHFVATPIAYIFQKVVYREKIVNRKVLQPYLINGFYIYGNHTRAAGDNRSGRKPCRFPQVRHHAGGTSRLERRKA